LLEVIYEKTKIKDKTDTAENGFAQKEYQKDQIVIRKLNITFEGSVQTFLNAFKYNKGKKS
jgi:hypothetical protein